MWLRELCRDRAQTQPERSAYSFLGSTGDVVQELSYGVLDRQARALANILLRRTSEGARVVLVFEAGLDFVVGFYACVYAGRIAVPVAAPRLRGAACERLRTVWRSAEAEAVLSHRSVLARAAWSEVGVPATACIDLDAVRSELEVDAPLQREDRVDHVFIQYTSGSTSEPKGVVVSQESLKDNLRHIQKRFRHHPETRGVGWLPMHHDMGLVGGVLEPMHTGFHAVLMSPLDFVQRPARWLSAVHRFQAEVSGGPTFGYEHCVEHVRESQCAGLDLSSWKVAFVGAEAVRAEVLEAFSARFGAFGFRKSAFLPCYGMAEATLMISGATAHEGPSVMRVDGDALAKGQVIESDSGDRALVDCGEVVDGHSVRVVDPTTGNPCPDGTLGELWVAGASVAAGYWGARALTEQTFKASIPGDPGAYLRTGDVGCLLDNRIVVYTRLKTQIILRGMNLAPEDIEAAAQEAAPELVVHGGAAFAAAGPAGERLVLVQEIRRDALRSVALRALTRTVVESIVRGFGVNAEVVFVVPGAVPRTTSGKIQRFKTRDLYEQGSLATQMVNVYQAAQRVDALEVAS